MFSQRRNFNDEGVTESEFFFLYCGLVFVPITGLLCVGWIKKQVRPWLQHFVRGGVISLLSLILMEAFAKLIFPSDQSLEGFVSGASVVAMTIPVVVISLIFVVWEARTAGESRWVKTTKAAILVMVYCFGVFYGLGVGAPQEDSQWSYRTALPSSASEIEESFHTDPFFPDYSYWLRAKISKEQFFNYVEHFELSDRGGIDIGEHFYSAEKGDWRMSARYSDGYLEVNAAEW